MTLQMRTSGLTLAIDDALRGALTLGWLEADQVQLEPLPPAFDEERDRVIGRLVTRYAGKSPNDIPGVAETRALFHRLDVDPTKTRPSSEALLRRALQGKGLPKVNPAVDVCNLASLEAQLPLGLYDRDLIKGGIRVRAGRAGEGYPGIRKQFVNLGGRLLLADDDGPFGAPTSDSLRSAVTERTRSLLVVLFCPLERSSQDLSSTLERIADLLGRFCAASITGARVMQ